jgi:hypothetical protein
LITDTIFEKARLSQQQHQPSPDKDHSKVRKHSVEEMIAYEQRVFSIVSENTGKLTFLSLLELFGGTAHKQILYKALASLTKQGRIIRIRGIGKNRIEFFYHDKKKLKKPALSASVSFLPS